MKESRAVSPEVNADKESSVMKDNAEPSSGYSFIDYHDHAKDKPQKGTPHMIDSHDEDGAEQPKSVARGGVVIPFPWKLHDMLDRVDVDGFASVVSWQPHGRSFIVHKPCDFVEKLMPKYFNQTKFASFQRQLNLYGFRRLTSGRDKGAYFHEYFLRGRRSLCHGMNRKKIKGTKVRRSVTPGMEPNFYDMPFMPTTKKLPAAPVGTSKRSSHPLKTKNNKKTTTTRKRPTTMKLSIKIPITKTERRSKNKQRKILIKPSTLATPDLSPEASPVPVTPDYSGRSTWDMMNKGDDLLFFEGKPFHYLDRFQEVPLTLRPQLSQPVGDKMDLFDGSSDDIESDIAAFLDAGFMLANPAA